MANFKAVTMQGGFHTNIQNANKVNVGSGIDTNTAVAMSIGDTNTTGITIGHSGISTLFIGGVDQAGGAFNFIGDGPSSIKTTVGNVLTLQSGSDDIEFNNDAGNSIFRVKQILQNSATLNGVMTTGGSTLVLLVSATGIRTGPALAGYDVQIDGVTVGSITTFRTVATAEHVVMTGTIVTAAILAGAVHTFAFVAQAGTTTDANDRFNMTVLELPMQPSL